MAVHQTFQYEGFQIEYATRGSGAIPVICLHGFNRPLEDMLIFESILKPEEYLVSIQLFHHGKSKIPEDFIVENGIPGSVLSLLILRFLDHLKARNFNLIAYSIGGRVSMYLLTQMPELIKKILLVAPDGLYVNPFYQWMNHSFIGRKIFKSVLQKPKPFLGIVDLLWKAKIIPSKLHRFVHVHMGADRSEQERLMIYNCWQTYKFSYPDFNALSRCVSEQKINWQLILGEFDSVIKVKHAKKLPPILKAQGAYHILPSGHLLLNLDTIKYIQSNHLW